MPSMSRWGCIGHAAPGTSVSSLNTRRSPKPMFASSQYWSKLKCQYALNQPPSAWNNAGRGRSWMVIALVCPPTRAANALGGLAEVGLQLLEETLLRHVAHETLRLATVLEQDHRGDRADAEATCGHGVRIDVELGDLDLLALLARDLLEDRPHHAAEAAPGRPEVHEHRRIRLEHVLLEALVVHHLRLCHLGHASSTT